MANNASVKLSDSKDLREAAGTLRQCNKSLRDKINEMEKVEGILAKQWKGEDQRKFHNNFVTDKRYMDQFCQVIEEYAAALEKAAGSYEERLAKNLEILS